MLLYVRPIVAHTKIGQLKVFAVHSVGHIQQQLIKENIVRHVFHIQI